LYSGRWFSLIPTRSSKFGTFYSEVLVCTKELFLLSANTVKLLLALSMMQRVMLKLLAKTKGQQWVRLVTQL